MSIPIPAAPPLAYTSLASFLPITGSKTPISIESIYALYRGIRRIALNQGSGTMWPRFNVPVFSGTITGLSATSAAVTLTDSAAAFGSPMHHGASIALTGCYIEIFRFDDPRWTARGNLTATSTGTTLTLVAQANGALSPVTDWIGRGVITALSDLVGCGYIVLAAGDIGPYDRWMEPPNSDEYVGNPTIGAQNSSHLGHAGSIGLFPTYQLTPPGSGAYTVTVGSHTTTALAFGASASAIQTALAGLTGVGTGNVTVTAYGTGFSLAFAKTLYPITCTASGATIAALSGVLLDTVQAWTLNQWKTAQPTYPDTPTSFDLVVQDNGPGGDSLVHRLTILSNTPTLIVFAPDGGGWVPSQGAYYSIVKHGGIWHPLALAGPRNVWYRGAMTDGGLATHMPDDSLTTYPNVVPAIEVSTSVWDAGVEGCVSGWIQTWEQDAWTDPTDQCTPDKCYSPDFFKTIRGIQWAIGYYCRVPQIDPTWGTASGPGGVNPTSYPLTLTFPLACVLAGVNGWIGNLSVSGGVGTISLPGGLPYPQATLFFTIVKHVQLPTEADVIDAYVVCTSATVTLATGLDPIEDGDTVYCTWGFSQRFDYQFRYLTGKSVWIPSVNIVPVDPPAIVTVGGISTSYLGSWSTKPKSTAYARFDLGTGGLVDDPADGVAFTAGDVAEFSGDNACDPTTDTPTGNALAPYMDRGYVGTNGTTPTNPDYAGVMVAADGSLTSTGITTDGTAAQLAGMATGWGNTSGVTTHVTVPLAVGSNWFESWYTNPATKLTSTITGTATSGTATTLVDSAAPFLLGGKPNTRLFGGMVAVTHATVITTWTINGISSDGKTLNLVAQTGLAVAVGDAYIVAGVPDATLKILMGIATTGGSTSMVDSTYGATAHPANAWFDPNLLTGLTLKVFHGSTSQTLTKFLITGATSSSGALTLQGVDGASITATDMWEIDIPLEKNRWQDRWITFTPPTGGNLGSGANVSVDVQTTGNDQNSIWLASTAGFVMVAGSTFVIESFSPGVVLKRNSTNTRWLSTSGQTENRTDPATGNKPPFHDDEQENLPFAFPWYGRARRGTHFGPGLFNELLAVMRQFTALQSNVSFRGSYTESSPGVGTEINYASAGSDSVSYPYNGTYFFPPSLYPGSGAPDYPLPAANWAAAISAAEGYDSGELANTSSIITTTQHQNDEALALSGGNPSQQAVHYDTYEVYGAVVGGFVGIILTTEYGYGVTSLDPNISAPDVEFWSFGAMDASNSDPQVLMQNIDEGGKWTDRKFDAMGSGLHFRAYSKWDTESVSPHGTEPIVSANKLGSLSPPTYPACLPADSGSPTPGIKSDESPPRGAQVMQTLSWYALDSLAVYRPTTAEIG
jgi:hypothetical protein